MTRRKLRFVAWFGAIGLSVVAYSAGDTAPLPDAISRPAVTQATEDGDGVRSITLPQLPVELPEAPGRNLVVANCMICHSPSYIMMQPAFPRKTWEANVTKMRTTFGAPIPEAMAPQIVDYLMQVRGTAEAATQPSK